MLFNLFSVASHASLEFILFVWIDELWYWILICRKNRKNSFFITLFLPKILIFESQSDEWRVEKNWVWLRHIVERKILLFVSETRCQKNIFLVNEAFRICKFVLTITRVSWHKIRNSEPSSRCASVFYSKRMRNVKPVSWTFLNPIRYLCETNELEHTVTCTYLKLCNVAVMLYAASEFWPLALGSCQIFHWNVDSISSYDLYIYYLVFAELCV